MPSPSVSVLPLPLVSLISIIVAPAAILSSGVTVASAIVGLAVSGCLTLIVTVAVSSWVFESAATALTVSVWEVLVA